MDQMTDFNKVMLVIVLIGWAFNLGILWQMSRGHGDKLKEQDKAIQGLRESHDAAVRRIHERIDEHHEKQEIHTSPEWREEMRGFMGGLSNKMDALQQQCMQRISKGNC